MSVKEKIAKRVAKELNDGDVVNLGIGLPTMVADYAPEGISFFTTVRKWYDWIRISSG